MPAQLYVTHFIFTRPKHKERCTNQGTVVNVLWWHFLSCIKEYKLRLKSLVKEQFDVEMLYLRDVFRQNGWFGYVPFL
jgi:hypothetical protein